MMLDIEEDFSSKTWIIGSVASLMTGIGCLFGKYELSDLNKNNQQYLGGSSTVRKMI